MLLLLLLLPLSIYNYWTATLHANTDDYSSSLFNAAIAVEARVHVPVRGRTEHRHSWSGEQPPLGWTGNLETASPGRAGTRTSSSLSVTGPGRRGTTREGGLPTISSSSSTSTFMLQVRYGLGSGFIDSTPALALNLSKPRPTITSVQRPTSGVSLTLSSSHRLPPFFSFAVLPASVPTSQG
ncbi:hypothetical protein G7046_g315 [Stylonectria norvegica]|nr:hypothetical protein G7046_g315 [Stylonectria norvegica]